MCSSDLTGLLFGLLNAGVAVWALLLFRRQLRQIWAHASACAAVLALLLLAFAGADHLTTWAEDRFYGGDVVLREQTPYQRIVVTSGSAGVRLFLNGNLQFHSRDEYRYHEALVHPAVFVHHRSAHGKLGVGGVGVLTCLACGLQPLQFLRVFWRHAQRSFT